MNKQTKDRLDEYARLGNREGMLAMFDEATGLDRWLIVKRMYNVKWKIELWQLQLLKDIAEQGQE